MDEERRTLWLEEEKRRNALIEEEERHFKKRCRDKEVRQRKFWTEMEDMKETVSHSIERKMREVMGEIVPQIMAAVSRKKKV